MNETEFLSITNRLDALVLSLRGDQRDQLESAVETIRAVHWNTPLFELIEQPAP